MTPWWQKYVGIPFADNGRSHLGVDCGGLAWLIYKDEKRVNVPCFGRRYSAYKPWTVGLCVGETVSQFFQKCEPQEFALAIFGRHHTDYHVGVFVDETRIIHAKEDEHVKVVSLSEMDFRNDYRGAYALTAAK